MPQRRGRRLLVGALVGLLAATALGALSGCQFAFGPQVKISGAIYGEQVAAREAGKSVPTPLQGTVTCNGAATTADSQGVYSISVSQASAYTCIATAPDSGRVTAKVKVPKDAKDAKDANESIGSIGSIVLNFGPKPLGACTRDDTSGVTTCGVLPPAPASLRGTVTDAATDEAIPNALVKCWSAALDEAPGKPARITATTDSRGSYVLHNLPVGPYGCVADPDQTLQTTTLAPGQTTTLDIPVCTSKCAHFKYRLGNVVHRLTAYLIFWVPGGYSLEPFGSDSRFQQLMGQYMQDVGGTSFYNILTQYYDDTGGPVRNVVTLGGSYVDTERYPHAGTVSDPLLDSDISTEIERVISLKGGDWVSDPDHVFFLFTGFNVQECSSTDADAGCTFNHSREADFCAYHSYSASDLIYAYIPVIDSCLNLPTPHSPNNDPIADAVISIVSHEQFEAVSDPSLDGWFDNTTYEGEMADKCVSNFGAIRADGSNVTLARDHRYIVQEEWSLRDQACVLSYAPSPGS